VHPESSGGGGDAKSASLLATLSLSAIALAGAPALQPAGALPPPPPSRTKWTRLVHPSVLIGHVSSHAGALRGARACLALLADPAAPRGAARAAALELALCSTLSTGRRALARVPGAARTLLEKLCAEVSDSTSPPRSPRRTDAPRARRGPRPLLQCCLRYARVSCMRWNLRACLTCVGIFVRVSYMRWNLCSRVLHALESAHRDSRTRRARAGRCWRSRASSWRRR
jgi:hypothetical protein